MSRRKARKHAFILIFQMSFRDDENILDVAKTYFEEEQIIEGEEKQFILTLLQGAIDNKDKLDEIISEHSKGWEVDRINKVDAAIMRLCLYELLFENNIPKSVSINEAVELAKKYSTDESPAFINGVLGGFEKSYTDTAL